MPSIQIRPDSLFQNGTDNNYYYYDTFSRGSNKSYPGLADNAILSSENSVTFQPDPQYNESFAITDNSFLPGSQNTPLTAPELDLVTVQYDNFLQRLLGGSSADTEDLYWIIPTVLAVIALFVILALLMFYCVRHLELRLGRWCDQNCSCCSCCSHEDGETVALTSQNLATTTELKDAVLRKKWKNLRDYFGTEYSKRPINRSGDGADCPAWKSKWQYYSQLLFLKDIVAPRKSSGPLSDSNYDVATDSQNSAPVFGPASPTESIDSEVININPNDTTDSLVAGASSTSPTLTPTPPPKFTSGRKRKMDPSFINHYEKLLEIEQQKVALLTERSHNKELDDDDLLFLKSLHPFIKRIPMERKMAFRSRVQLLIDEFSHSTSNTGNSFSNEQYQQLPSAIYRTYNSLLS